MKQYVSFQRLDIICSIQCLTEFYLKRFLPDLLLIQVGGFRKGGKFSVCEHTHGIAVLHRVGKVKTITTVRPCCARLCRSSISWNCAAPGTSGASAATRRAKKPAPESRTTTFL